VGRVRVVVSLDGGRIRATTSRNDREVVAAYPELRTLLVRFPCRRVILYGEIVVLDPSGRPGFSLLQ
jgi:bifunctional non-homologous end joining protein LigD